MRKEIDYALVVGRLLICLSVLCLLLHFWPMNTFSDVAASPQVLRGCAVQAVVTRNYWPRWQVQLVRYGDTRPLNQVDFFISLYTDDVNMAYQARLALNNNGKLTLRHHVETNQTLFTKSTCSVITSMQREDENAGSNGSKR